LRWRIQSALHGVDKTTKEEERTWPRLVTALVAEVSDEWEIGRAYLVMESE
jgi:hypothetical protein